LTESISENKADHVGAEDSRSYLTSIGKLILSIKCDSNAVK